MLGLDEFSRVVTHLHGCSAEPNSWAPVLAELTDLLDATACTVALGAGRDRSILSTTICDDAANAYTSYYHQHDFVMRTCESGPVGLLRGGNFAEHRKTEYYTDWQRRYDMTDGLFVRLSASSPCSFIVSASPRREPYGTADQVKFVNALIPHLQKVLSARHDLRAIVEQPDNIGAAPDSIRHGVIVIGLEGRILQMNAAARLIMSAGDGLCVRGNKVRATWAATDDELQAAIGKALIQPDTSTRVSTYLVCERVETRRPYALHVLPLDNNDDPRLARAVITIIDTGRSIKTPKILLRKLFGLTDAECDVALRMLNGKEPKAIAENKAVSIATVRTHIQNIYRKTNTHRQADLIRVLTTAGP